MTWKWRVGSTLYINYSFSFHGWTTLVGQGLLTVKVSRSHSDTPYSVRLLRTSDRLIAETATWQPTTFSMDRYPWHRRDWKTQCQQARGHSPAPYSTRPPGSANYSYNIQISSKLHNILLRRNFWTMQYWKRLMKFRPNHWKIWASRQNLRSKLMVLKPSCWKYLTH